YAEDHDNVLDRAMIADQRFHLQSVLAKVDAMSMANSLEVRVPLLDRRIMDLAGKIDVSLLNPAPKGPPKLVLRKLAERLGMPQSVATARKKGFNVPIARLLRRDLAPIGDEVLDRNADVLAPYVVPAALIWVLSRVTGLTWTPAALASPTALLVGLVVNQIALCVFALRMQLVLRLFEVRIGWLPALRIHLQSMFYFFALPMTVGL